MVPELHGYSPVEYVIGTVQRGEGWHAPARRRPTPGFGEQLDVEPVVVVLHSEIVRIATYYPLT